MAIAGSLLLFHRSACDSEETSTAVVAFALMMNFERDPVSASERTMDRNLIRVDVTPTQAGITAALRRAFEAAAMEPCEHDFAELLRRLN
jgi:hypothetical protein